MNMHSTNRTRYIQITFTAIAVFIMMVRIAHTDELENKQKALNVITAVADHICQKVPLEGHELSGQAKAELSNGLKQIADLGYKSSAYQGVLQDELASSIKTGNDCRLSVLENLRDKLLPASDRRSDLSKPDFLLIAEEPYPDEWGNLLLINKGGQANNIDYFDEAKIHIGCGGNFELPPSKTNLYRVSFHRYTPPPSPNRQDHELGETSQLWATGNIPEQLKLIEDYLHDDLLKYDKYVLVLPQVRFAMRVHLKYEHRNSSSYYNRYFGMICNTYSCRTSVLGQGNCETFFSDIAFAGPEAEKLFKLRQDPFFLFSSAVINAFIESAPVHCVRNR